MNDRPALGIRLPEDWGIQPVPQEKRQLRPFDLAVLWGDLAVSLLVMVAGALLVPGLGTREAMAAVFIGTLAGALVLTLDPDAIVLGTIVERNPDLFLAPIAERVRERVFPVQRDVRIIPGELGERRPAYAALCVALDPER